MPMDPMPVTICFSMVSAENSSPSDRRPVAACTSSTMSAIIEVTRTSPTMASVAPNRPSTTSSGRITGAPLGGSTPSRRRLIGMTPNRDARAKVLMIARFLPSRAPSAGASRKATSGVMPTEPVMAETSFALSSQR